MIRIPSIRGLSIEEISSMLDQTEAVPLACNPWPQYKADVKVSFAIAHSEDAIFLKYYVKEKHLLANATLNGNIHEDSCVEFFIAFEGDTNYYNLEFNYLGTAKIGYGKDRTDRELLNESLIRTVDFVSTIRPAGWELILKIPAAVFNYQQLSGLQASGNFYKCGDLLPAPHYLSWKMIQAPDPNFHCPEAFGTLQFLK